jgi:hypothetical protein
MHVLLLYCAQIDEILWKDYCIRGTFTAVAEYACLRGGVAWLHSCPEFWVECLQLILSTRNHAEAIEQAEGKARDRKAGVQP